MGSIPTAGSWQGSWGLSPAGVVRKCAGFRADRARATTRAGCTLSVGPGCTPSRCTLSVGPAAAGGERPWGGLVSSHKGDEEWGVGVSGRRECG